MSQRRERIFSGERFSVDRMEIPARDGGTRARELVVHPGSVVILPLLPDGRVVLIHNRRHTLERTLLELPAGTLHPGEDPRLCAERELAEETGYRAGALTPLLSFFVCPGVSDERMYAFLATALTPGDTQLDETEQITLALMEPAQLERRILEGGVEDAKTVAVWLYYRLSAAGGGRPLP